MLSLSRRVSTRVLVQAFSTRGLVTTTAARALVNRPQQQFYVPRQFSSARDVAVEEDLDAALDNLLGDAVKEGKDSEHHMKDSKPVPPTLVETVSLL